MTRRTTLAAAATLALTALPACGGDEPPTNELETTINGWHAAIADDDGDRACRYLTRRARVQFTDAAPLGDLGGCEGAVSRVAAMLSDDQRAAMGRLRVRRAHVDGDRAEVRAEDVEFPQALTELRDPDAAPTVLRRLDGRWLIEDLG